MNHRRPTTATLLFLTAFGLVALGCGSAKEDRWTKERPLVHPTSGQVLLNGKPVAEATVTFQPVDPAGKPGFAATDRVGKFEVQTFDPDDGLTAGKFRVAIQKTTMVDAEGNEVKEITDDGAGLTERNFLPKKYASFADSGLEVQIEAGKKNELEPFNLTE